MTNSNRSPAHDVFKMAFENRPKAIEKSCKTIYKNHSVIIYFIYPSSNLWRSSGIYENNECPFLTSASVLPGSSLELAGRCSFQAVCPAFRRSAWWYCTAGVVKQGLWYSTYGIDSIIDQLISIQQNLRY